MGWPAGFQKMGVTTTGPVSFVPITGPPWKISGGVPFAVSPAAPDILASVMLQPAFADTALTTPEICPTRVWTLDFETQALFAREEVLATANVDVPSTVAAAVPSATRVKVARSPRLMNALFIRVPSSRLASFRPRRPGLSGPGQYVRLETPFRALHAASSDLSQRQPKSDQTTAMGSWPPSGSPTWYRYSCTTSGSRSWQARRGREDGS